MVLAFDAVCQLLTVALGRLITKFEYLDADNDRISVQSAVDFAAWSDIFQSYVKRRDSGFDQSVLRIYVDDPLENADLKNFNANGGASPPTTASAGAMGGSDGPLGIRPPSTPPPSLASGTGSSSSSSVSDSLLAVLLRNPEMLLEIPQLLSRLLQVSDPQYIALQDARRNNDAAKSAAGAAAGADGAGADSQDAMAKIIKLLEALGLDDQQQQAAQQPQSSSSSATIAVTTNSDSLTSSTGFVKQACCVPSSGIVRSNLICVWFDV
jgi:hypothetical protein